jgi:hypothetical protein
MRRVPAFVPLLGSTTKKENAPKPEPEPALPPFERLEKEIKEDVQAALAHKSESVGSGEEGSVDFMSSHGEGGFVNPLLGNSVNLTKGDAGHFSIQLDMDINDCGSSLGNSTTIVEEEVSMTEVEIVYEEEEVSVTSRSTDKAEPPAEKEWDPMAGAAVYTANQEPKKKEWNPMVGASAYTANQEAPAKKEWDPMAAATTYIANQEPAKKEWDPMAAATTYIANQDVKAAANDDDEDNHFVDRFKKTADGKVKWGKSVKTKVPAWKRMYSF